MDRRYLFWLALGTNQFYAAISTLAHLLNDFPGIYTDWFGDD